MSNFKARLEVFLIYRSYIPKVLGIFLSSLKMTENYVESTLHFAAQRGNQPAIKRILKHTNINSVDRAGKTALQLACEIGHVGTVELLLKNGADVNKRLTSSKEKDVPCIYFATDSGRREIVKLLLLYNGDINATNVDGLTALHRACANGDSEIAELLLEQGASVDATNTKSGMTALHYACENGQSNVCEVLIKCGADVNFSVDSSSHKGKTPLHFAAANGDEDSVRILLNHNANPIVRDGRNYSALHVASTCGFSEIAELLLQTGAYVKRRAVLSESLRLAAASGKKDAVALLLRHYPVGVKPTDQDGWTALQRACENGHADVAELLLQSGARLNYKCNAKHRIQDPPLSWAVTNGNKETVELLLRYSADINDINAAGETALYTACRNNNSYLAELLLKAGADVNYSPYYRGLTPLFIASLNCNEDVVKLLLRHHADVKAAWLNGHTALHVACEKRQSGIVEMLLKSGADANLKRTHPWISRNPMNAAFDSYNPHFDDLSHNATEALELLLEFGADVNRAIEDQDTPPLFDGVKIKKTIVKHIVQMQVQKLFVSENSLRFCLANEELIGLKDSCVNEIEIMQRQRIGRSNVTFFDILSKDKHRLASYLQNEDIVNVLKNQGSFLSDFPIYANLISKRFARGLEWRDLFPSSSDCLYSALNKFCNVPLVCVMKILSYLSYRDLVNVAKAKPMETQSSQAGKKRGRENESDLHCKKIHTLISAESQDAER